MNEANQVSKTQTVEGTVSKILFSSPDSFFHVFLVTTGADQGYRTVKMVGKVAKLSIGEAVSATGRFGQNPRYKGESFQIEQIECKDPITDYGLVRALEGLVPGLGPMTATKIVAHFGGAEETVAAFRDEKMDQDEQGNWSHGGIEGVSDDLFGKILTAWRARRQEREADAALASLGLPEWLRNRLREFYGPGAYQVVSEDPYRLAFDINGVGFKTADDLAKKLGIVESDPRRAEASVAHVLTEGAFNDGHTCLLQDDVLRKCARLLTPVAMSLDTSPPKLAIERLLSGGKVVEWKDAASGTSRVALGAIYQYESEIAGHLRRLVRHSATDPRGALMEGIDDATYDTLLSCSASTAIMEFEAQTGMRLADAQKEAVYLVANKGACVITGGPGTGKTSCTQAICVLFDHAGVSYALCAPTGRAARRLAEVTHHEASTIHRLLGYGMGVGRRFLHHALNPLPYDAVLVDEVSMVDSELMASLVEGLKPGARLVLVGDVDQLPPVGPGAPFRDILAAQALPCVRLTEVFRQAQGSLIVQSAHEILAGRSPRIAEKGDRRDGALFFVEEEDEDCARDRIVQIVRTLIPQEFGVPPSDIQVLSPMHRGSCGTEQLNEVLQEAINPAAQKRAPCEKPSSDSTQFVVGERVFRVGDRVRQTKNDYDRFVVNGEIGYVHEVFSENRSKGKALSVRMENVNEEDRIVPYSSLNLQHLQLAYASSIHSSQGGEYPAVVVALVRGHTIMLARTLLYTAITRAKKLCMIVGDRHAIKRAVQNVRVNSRLTVLPHLFQMHDRGRSIRNLQTRE